MAGAPATLATARSSRALDDDARAPKDRRVTGPEKDETCGARWETAMPRCMQQEVPKNARGVGTKQSDMKPKQNML